MIVVFMSEVVPMLELRGLLVKVGIQVKELNHLQVDVIGLHLLIHRGEPEEPLIGQAPVFLPLNTFLKQAALGF
jgi:hypothetical protein